MNEVCFPFEETAVAGVFENFPDASRAGLLLLRDLVFDVAALDPRIGKLTETLKWGQPSYLTLESKSGTPIRLGVQKLEVSRFSCTAKRQ